MITDLWPSLNFVSMKNIQILYNPMVDLSKFTSNKKMLGDDRCVTLLKVTLGVIWIQPYIKNRFLFLFLFFIYNKQGLGPWTYRSRSSQMFLVFLMEFKRF